MLAHCMSLRWTAIKNVNTSASATEKARACMLTRFKTIFEERVANVPRQRTGNLSFGLVDVSSRT